MSHPRPRRASRATMIGRSVMIFGGMQEFAGRTGTILDVERHEAVSARGPTVAGPAYYRIRLDHPVEIPGVGLVEEDIWNRAGFRLINARLRDGGSE
jgi:hypothetical protein